MLNQATLIGNLGQDPETKTTGNGLVICNFSLATSHRVKNGNAWEDRTEWHRCVCFGKTAEFVGQYATKGRQLFVQGRIQTRKWQDKDGNERWSTEIVADQVRLLGPRPEGAGGGVRQTPDNYTQNTPDEDIPF